MCCVLHYPPCLHGYVFDSHLALELPIGTENHTGTVSLFQHYIPEATDHSRNER